MTCLVGAMRAVRCLTLDICRNAELEFHHCLRGSGLSDGVAASGLAPSPNLVCAVILKTFNFRYQIFYNYIRVIEGVLGFWGFGVLG